MTKGLQEYTPPASVAPSSSTLPSTRSPKKTPSHPQAGSKRVPGTAPSLGSAGSPATVSSRAQTANEIDKIVRLPSTVLAKIARSTTCEQLMATKTMIGDEDAPTIFQLLMRIPPEPEDVPYPEHPGLPLLLGKGYIPDYPGIVCSPQPRSEEWPSRRAWAQSRLKSLLPRKEMALQVEEWALTQLVDYTISVDDYQIHLETESANHYALIAANAVVARIKARGQGRESEKEPETAQVGHWGNVIVFIAFQSQALKHAIHHDRLCMPVRFADTTFSSISRPGECLVFRMAEYCSRKARAG